MASKHAREPEYNGSTDAWNAYQNDPSLEAAWAMKATEYMEIHFNLLCSVYPGFLKLTAHDDEIYEEFKLTFPGFNLAYIDPDYMKTKSMKEHWIRFYNKVGHLVEDAKFGTLLRSDSSGSYSEENTFVVVRLQFLAIEIARNRDGFNNEIQEKFKYIDRALRQKEPVHQSGTDTLDEER